MRRVLLVDDEPFFRAALRGLVAWERGGWQVAGEAINGAEALGHLEGGGFDAVITDIRMPVMDGVDLIRRARARGCGAGFVVLSAYDEFPLVKGAFLAGARDYLLKAELTSERVLAALQRAVTAEAVTPPSSTGDPSRWEGSRVCVACFEAGDEARARLLEQRLRSDAGLTDAEIVPLPQEGRCAAVLSFEVGRRWTEIEAEVEALARRVAAGAITVGVSRVAESPREIGALLAEARRACAAAFFRGSGKVIHAARLAGQAAAGAAAAIDRQAPARLAELLARRDTEGLSEMLPRLAVGSARLAVEDIPEIRALFAAHAEALASFCGELAADRQRPLAAAVERLRSLLAAAADLTALNAALREAAEQALAVAAGTSRLVRLALALVHDDRLSRPSLAAAARRLGVTPGYLSRAFSRDLGVPFTTHAARARMRAAAALLRDTPLRVHEVAERVGYPAVEHFSRTFRRVMGESPQSYRQRGTARRHPSEPSRNAS